ncbi:GLPGLI family protein [Lutibacter maritimus]|uniref:GLPGLI family protein n=1 Tax=Lutibacter maritimus TaxID=593133 RepID=A0A1I6R1Y6_9FLAO|nr:GLPGLI family protein [Lutibacter maritimus]SFS58716.1 GLPGLI family protein [Lutibacter maritimus]
MKNYILKYFSVFTILFVTAINAQNFQGMAVYQTKTKMSMDLAGSGIPADRIKMIEERMKSMLEKTYVLTFDKTASIYKEEQKLDQAGGPGGGMRFMVMGGGATGDYYKNTQTKTSTKENEFSGKNFLIKDNLVTYDWKMEQETKMIGQNMCFKATTVVEMPKRNTSFNFRRPEDRKEEEKEPEEPKMEAVIVTAWYTLDIPVSHGPGEYWGLPGLILEISYGETNILCTKIVMNPKEKSEISEPTKGKVVTQEEYDTIIKEKMQEMRERMQNERQKGGNEGHFRVRG